MGRKFGEKPKKDMTFRVAGATIVIMVLVYLLFYPPNFF